MGIRESALSTLSALTNNDFIRMVSSAGASRKATLQAIAQHIIENYAGSSLAGSNQSVKAAIDGLNSNLTFVKNNQDGMFGQLANKNIDQMPANGYYGTFFLNNADSMVSGTKPANGQGILFCLKQSTELSRQIYIGVSGVATVARYYRFSTGVWTDWVTITI